MEFRFIYKNESAYRGVMSYFPTLPFLHASKKDKKEKNVL